MAAEPLCIRTFANVVQKHMNKKSVIKILDYSNKFQPTGCQETKDAQGVFVFYALLIDSPLYAKRVDSTDNLPDVSKQMTSYLKNGQSEVHARIVEIAQEKDAVANTSTCFSINLIPNIPKTSLPIVLDTVLELIQNDTNLGKTTQQNFKKWRKDRTESDFLAEAFVLAIRSGKNKIAYSVEIADEIMPLIKNIDDIQAKLNTLPRINGIEPPDNPESHEKVYISALLDAYDDASETENLPSDDLSKHPKYEKDLKQRRIEYFAAESVKRGTREVFKNGDPDNMFSALKDETYNGVIDVHSMDYKHGYERLQKVMAHATMLQLNNCILGRIPNWVGTSQKKGVCHMLVNDKRIEGWVDNDD